MSMQRKTSDGDRCLLAPALHLDRIPMPYAHRVPVGIMEHGDEAAGLRVRNSLGYSWRSTITLD
jgi:hypothetical protein